MSIMNGNVFDDIMTSMFSSCMDPTDDDISEVRKTDVTEAIFVFVFIYFSIYFTLFYFIFLRVGRRKFRKVIKLCRLEINQTKKCTRNN